MTRDEAIAQLAVVNQQINSVSLEIQYTQANITGLQQQIYWANWNLQQPGINQDQINWYNNQIRIYNDQLSYYNNRFLQLNGELSSLNRTATSLNVIINMP